MRNTTLKTVAAAAAVSFALAACGGGGGGGSSGSGSGSGTGTGTTTTSTSNGQALLAAYTPPADIAGDVVTNYSGPSFNSYVGTSGLQSACSGSTVSTTVVDAPDTIVFSANGASVKAQQLAADQFENQALPTVRTALALPATGTAFDGQNKVVLCVDKALGQGIGETGTAITGQTVLGLPGPVVQLMSADSPNFDTRYPGATSLDAMAPLVVHESTHAALYSLMEPFGGGEIWFQEGTAQTIAGQSIGTKASVLATVQAGDVLAASNPNTDLSAYGAYEATLQYLTSSAAGGLGFGLANLKNFVATYKADAMTLCAQPIPSGTIPPVTQTTGMPTGQYNACVGGAGSIDTRVQAAFDTAFNSTFKDSNGSPLLLHTADGANSLEATLYQRLSAFLP
ncbi:hypothetical protein LGM54_30565 [Burkholderia cenocepacia]|uniref:hypothetical protein n=1 Tax=Burkholderia cenocepacia TaxID=95486 RepID=UPI001CF259DA|nr:hypothetical protein [Burkholderia cenocepacia]MCA7967329.1 hypothetical protein [Burkholderia cenocepacia]